MFLGPIAYTMINPANAGSAHERGTHMDYSDWVESMRAQCKAQPVADMAQCESCNGSGWAEGDPFADDNDYVCGNCNGVGWVDPD